MRNGRREGEVIGRAGIEKLFNSELQIG